MSDLLEDQKIHYIVRDYRRMFNNYWILKDIIQTQDSLLEKKEKRIQALEAKLASMDKSQLLVPKQIKGLIHDIEGRTSTSIEYLQKEVTRLNKNLETIDRIREFIV